MTHRDYVRPFGVWQPTAVPTAADVGALDAGAAALVNGDNGGAWNPASPIVIGGAGFSGTGTVIANLTTRNGGTIQWPVYNYPTLPSVNTRSVQVDLVRACGNFGYAPNGLTVSLSPFGVKPTIPSGAGMAFAIPKRYLHNGARLTKITLNMVIQDVGIPFTPGASPFHVAPSLALIVSEASGGIMARSDAAAAPWKSGTVYAANALVVPTNAKTDGFVYLASPGGTSAGTEPAWPGDLVTSIVDNTVTWRGIARSGRLPNASAIADYSSGGQVLESVPLSVGGWVLQHPPYNVIDTSRFEYTVQIKQDTLAIPGVVFTSIQLDYTTTPGLLPE